MITVKTNLSRTREEMQYPKLMIGVHGSCYAGVIVLFWGERKGLPISGNGGPADNFLMSWFTDFEGEVTLSNNH